MLIFKQHLELLREIESEKKNVYELYSLAKAGEKYRLTRRLTELMIMGLVEIVNDFVSITKSGELIIDAVNWLEANVTKINELTLPNDIWINSQVIKMIEIIKATDIIPDEWKIFLSERGLISENKLNESAELVYQAYKKTIPLVYITSDLAEFIAGMPLGPADYKSLLRYKEITGYGQNVIYAMEGMRLLQISPPWNGKVVYNLTKAGKLIKSSLEKIPLYKPLMYVNGRIRVLLSKGVKELNLEEKKELGDMGLYNVQENNYTELGRSLAQAYDLLRSGIEEVYPIFLMKEELNVLKKISDLIKKNKDNPEIYPTRKLLGTKMNIEDLPLILNLLESKNLIERELWKNEEAFRLTQWGEIILKYFGTVTQDITTNAVKAITLDYSGDIPRFDYVQEAEKLGLLGTGGPTRKGKILLDLCLNIKRKFLISMYDVGVLMKTPMHKGITLDELREEIVTYLEDKFKVSLSDVNKAISEAESKGIIRVMQNNAVLLTSIGKVIKNAITSAKTDVIKGMKISITPLLIDAIISIKENEEYFAKLWREKERLDPAVIETLAKKLKISEDTAKEAITQLRGMGFIGRKRGGRILTGAGEELYKAAQLLAKKAE